MAKLLVSCDEYIYRVNGKYYAANESRKEFLCRYLRVFDCVKYVLRCIEEPELKPGRALMEGNRIEFVPVPIFHGPIQYAKNYFKVRRSVKNVVNGCDAAILRLPSTVAQLISGDVLKSRIPYAVEVVFDAKDGADTSESILEKILWKIIHHKMTKLCYNADGVSCVTEKYLQQRYFSKKANHFTSHYSTLALDKSFCTSPRQFPEKDILTIAHVDMQLELNGRKGTRQVIDALSLLKNRGIFVNVVFAGEDRGNSKEIIMEYAASVGVDKQVSCPGFLSRAELGSLLDRSDLFVLPTKAEGLPRVIIEAMAKGLPVVTTPASGNPELIREEYLVDYKDVEGMAQKIAELVMSKDAYERASKSNYNKSLEYAPDILQNRRDIFYSGLLKLCNS